MGSLLNADANASGRAPDLSVQEFSEFRVNMSRNTFHVYSYMQDTEDMGV